MNQSTSLRRGTRALGAILALLLATGLLAACGDDDGSTGSAGGATSTTAGSDSPDTTEGESPSGPSGTLRVAEFAPVATYDPAGAQTSQSAYLYAVYDTLTRQGEGFEVQPSLATSWEQTEPTTWRFELRDDVVFHDGAPFDAEVVKANLERQVTAEGNPNASVFATLDSVEVVDPYTVDVHFARPAPAFPLEMSMVMGMMISPNALDDDLTRAPAGSGPWIWNGSESQAGVIEIFDLNPDYWQPEDQGVERIEIHTIADNNARLNALLAGDVDMAATVRDDQMVQAQNAGMNTESVAAYLPFLVILDREGDRFAPLADVRVRQAIGYAIDREGFLQAVHAGQGDAIGGYYGPQFEEWYNPDLDDMYSYDPDRARELLADAGYADGFELEMPVMPNIMAPVEAIVQMLGQVGIRVQLDQIQAGQIGSYVRGGDAAITWYRALIYYPGKTYSDFVGPALNPFGLDDVADLREQIQAANASQDAAEQKAIFDDVAAEFMDRGIVFPLAHGRQNAAWAEHVTGPILLGLNMQAPLPYGIRVDG
jgi:peptide/nickel transport system substrate-binding protein